VEIRVENLDYVYSPGTPLEITALRDVSFTLPCGKVLGILGGTGSGKTTLVRNLNGLLVPTRGKVFLGGREIGDYGPDLRRKVGVVFQRPERQIFEDTVFKDISFVLRRFSSISEADIAARVEGACRLVGLDLKDVAERPPAHLSESEKRKTAIAGILINEPRVLVLDEPAVGLDPLSVGELIRALQSIKEAGDRSLVIVSHDMEAFLTLTDLLMVLENGKVAAFGTPQEVCRALDNHPRLGSLLPDLAVFVNQLQQAGLSIPSDEYRIPDLAEALAAVTVRQGGGSS